MATWGSQTWGYYNWGTLGDISITVSGQSTLSLSVGSVDQQSNPGWGAQYWGAGEWGDLSSPEVALTGQQITTTVSAVTAITDVVIEVTGELLGPIVIGDYVEGISVEADILGQQLNSTINSVFGGEVVTVEVTSASNEAWGENAWSIGAWGVGDGQTILVGETSVAIGQQINAQGQLITSFVNDVLAGISIVADPTSVTANTTTGTVSLESKYLIGSAEATTTVNSVDVEANADVIPTGLEIEGDTGQLEYEATYSLNGVEATAVDGDVFGGEVVEVQVRTASAQPWGELAWGDGEWGQSIGTDIAIGADAVLTPSIDVLVTGEQLDWTIGNETVTGDANVTLSGVSAEIFQGDETAFTDVTVILVNREQNNISIGNFVAGISQLVVPTGVTATTTSGTMGINAWAVIEPNASTTWSVVDKAAA
jgi:hypothetical protein